MNERSIRGIQSSFNQIDIPQLLWCRTSPEKLRQAWGCLDYGCGTITLFEERVSHFDPKSCKRNMGSTAVTLLKGAITGLLCSAMVIEAGAHPVCTTTIPKTNNDCTLCLAISGPCTQRVLLGYLSRTVKEWPCKEMISLTRYTWLLQLPFSLLDWFMRNKLYAVLCYL